MRIGWQIILFILILNLMSGLLYLLSVPGTAYTNILNTGTQAEAEDYESAFNATTMLQTWDPTPGVYIPVVDDFAQGVYIFYQGVRTVVMGFPDMVDSFAYAFPDPTVQNSVQALMLIVRAIMSFILFTWLFQIISGRRVSE